MGIIHSLPLLAMKMTSRRGGLLSVIFVVAICSLIISITFFKGVPQDLLLEELSEKRGVTISAGAFLDNPPSEVTFRGVAIGRGDLQLLGGLPCLRFLFFRNCELTRLEFESDEKLNALRRGSVWFDGGEFDRALLANSGLLNTERLRIVGWKVEASLIHSIGDAGVEELRLNSCTLLDGWPNAIVACAALTLLDIQGCDVKEEDVATVQSRRPDIVIDR